MRHLFSLRLLSGLLAFTLLASLSHGQSPPPASSDSLLKVLQGSKPDSNRANIYLQLGDFYLNKPGTLQADINTALAYGQKAEGLSLSIHFAQGYDKSQLLFARIFLENNQINEFIGLLKKSKPGKNKITLLLLAGKYYLYKPLELHADLDAAEGYARQAFDLSVRLKNVPGQVESLKTLADIYSEKGNRSKVAAYLRQAQPLISQAEDSLQKVRLWNELGDAYSRSEEELPEKINCYEQSLTLYRQMGNKEQEALTLKTIADMHQLQGKFPQSLGELLEVLRIQKSIHYANLHYTYDLLGFVYKVMGSYEHALPYALASIESAHATGDTISLDMFHYRVANIYAELGEHQKALESFQSLLLSLTQNKNSGRANIIFCAGEIRDQLHALNRPKEAVAFLRQTLMRYPPESPLEQFNASLYLGEAYADINAYTIAESHYLKALKAVNRIIALDNINPYGLIIFANQKLSKLYTQGGQYKKARHCLTQAFF